MTKQEFLNRMKEALENGLNGRSVQENMDYYRSYIEEEVSAGRSEEEVIDDLGDPWVIAQSVIDMAESRSGIEGGFADGNVYGERGQGEYGRQGYSNTQIHTYVMSGWKKLLFILGIIGIVLIIFAVIGGLISLAMPLVLPVLAFILVMRFIKRMR